MIDVSLADFNEPFNIMFSIGDIRNVDFGSNNKSYTIDIPLTKNNKRLIKYLNQPDVKSEPSEKVRLYLDDQLVIYGKLIVLSVSEFSAKVIINCDDWMDEIKDAKMTALNLTDSDHILNNVNVEASWSAVYPVYRYPLIDFGTLMSVNQLVAKWFPSDFIPMISIYHLITKILSKYQITSDWLTKIKDTFILGRETIADSSFTQNKALNVSVTNNSDHETSITITTGNTLDLTTVLRFTTETKDEAAKWSIDNYIIPATGTYRFKASIALINTARGNSNLNITNERVILSLTCNGTVLVNFTTPNYTGTELIDNITYILDSGYYHFVEDDVISVVISMQMNAVHTGGGGQYVTIGVRNTSTLELIWDKANMYSGINKNISLKEMLPDMTQLDFLAAIRDICNLRFWMDKNNNTIHIEPWDTFTNSNIVDITEFIDFSDGLPSELISSNYSKTTRLKWKDDDDQAYLEYLKQFIFGPGYLDITLSSLFAKPGIDIREHSFSSIPELNNYHPIPVPSIWNTYLTSTNNPYFDRKVGFNTRIVHWDGLTSGLTWNYDGVIKTQYPKISGLKWSEIYSDNWQKTFHSIDKGKLFTVKMKVKPAFLAQFMTKINDVTKEGFRPAYKITYQGIENLFTCQKITSDGSLCEMEMILR